MPAAAPRSGPSPGTTRTRTIRRIRCLVTLLLRLALAGVLATSGVAKFLDPQPAISLWAAFSGWPEASIHPAVIGLATGEIALALALLIPAWTRGAATLCGMLTMGFAMIVLRFPDQPCGCFGAAGQQLSVRTHLILLAGMLLASASLVSLGLSSVQAGSRAAKIWRMRW